MEVSYILSPYLRNRTWIFTAQVQRRKSLTKPYKTYNAQIQKQNTGCLALRTGVGPNMYIHMYMHVCICIINGTSCKSYKELPYILRMMKCDDVAPAPMWIFFPNRACRPPYSASPLYQLRWWKLVSVALIHTHDLCMYKNYLNSSSRLYIRSMLTLMGTIPYSEQLLFFYVPCSFSGMSLLG